MLQPKPERMSVAEFLEWNERQEERYELVDGFPRRVGYELDHGEPMRMMTGARFEHRRVVRNISTEIDRQVAPSGCFASTHDAAVPIGNDRVRYPDVVVECGSESDVGLEASDPRIVVDVLSPSNKGMYVIDRFNELRAHPRIFAIMFVDPDRVDVRVYRRLGRSGDGEATDLWSDERFHDLDGTITFDNPSATLLMAAIYEGLDPGKSPTA